MLKNDDGNSEVTSNHNNKQKKKKLTACECATLYVATAENRLRKRYSERYHPTNSADDTGPTRLEAAHCTMDRAKLLGGSKNERWGFLYVVLGTAFFLTLSVQIWRYPLFPFRLDDVAWFAQSKHFGLAARN